MFLPVILLSLGAGALICILMIAIAYTRVPFSYSFRNLVVRYRTTLGTVVAFVFIVGVLIVMLGFIQGLRELTRNTGSENNVVVLSEGATDETVSNLSVQEMDEISYLPWVSKVGGGTDRLPWVSRESFMVVIQSTKNIRNRSAPRSRLLQIRGLDDLALGLSIHGLEANLGGAQVSESGVQSASDGTSSPSVEVLLGKGVAATLGDKYRPLGIADAFEIGNRNFVVKGLLQSQGTTFDSEIWANRSIVAAVFGKSNYSTLVSRTDNASTAQEFQKYLSRVDPSNAFTSSNVNALVETEYYRSLGKSNSQIVVGTVLVAVILAIGGALAIMNTMFAAVGERFRDIAILKLHGFSRSGIVLSFLLESVLLAAVGGALSCLICSLANGISIMSTVGGSSGAARSVVFQLRMDSQVLAIGFLFALFMGFLGGFLPAMSVVFKKSLAALSK